MRAALRVLGGMQAAAPGRKIAVLGDMLELGDAAGQLHADLIGPVEDSGADLVYCSGPLMRALWERLPREKRAVYAEQSSALTERLKDELRPGDIIMIKGSLGSRMGPLVDALKQEYPAADEVASA
jgi:UDP-N-acetylmuramoyl-tripeptide--D-alanyl-D-alanine ligase